MGRSPSARRRRMLPGHPCLTAVPRPGAPIMSDGAPPVQDGFAGLSPLFLRDAFPSFPRSGAPEGFLLRSIRSRLRPCATSLSFGPRCHGARPRGLSVHLFLSFFLMNPASIMGCCHGLFPRSMAILSQLFSRYGNTYISIPSLPLVIMIMAIGRPHGQGLTLLCWAGRTQSGPLIFFYPFSHLLPPQYQYIIGIHDEALFLLQVASDGFIPGLFLKAPETFWKKGP